MLGLQLGAAEFFLVDSPIFHLNYDALDTTRFSFFGALSNLVGGEGEVDLGSGR